MVESSIGEKMASKEVGNELMISAQRKIIEIDRERQKMMDERAQRVPLYTGQTHLSQYMYQFLFCSNNPNVSR
jgi:hypothetical protein